jgi:hypothetical protein
VSWNSSKWMNSGNSSKWMYIAGCVGGALVLGMVSYFVSRRRKSAVLDLNAQLMEDDGEDDSKINKFVRYGGGNNPVWIAPAVPPVQFEPSSFAALDSAFAYLSGSPQESDLSESVQVSGGDDHKSEPGFDGIRDVDTCLDASSCETSIEGPSHIWLAPMT